MALAMLAVGIPMASALFSVGLHDLPFDPNHSRAVASLVGGAVSWMALAKPLLIAVLVVRDSVAGLLSSG